MVSVKSRRFAVPMVLASLGVLGGASTASAAGGLAVSPSLLEHRASVGKVGSLTLNNTTNEALKVTVTVRPWLQQLNGSVFSDPRSTFSRYVRATRTSFTLGAHSKAPVNFRMLRRTSSGSLYGNVDILGKPVKTRNRKGIIPQYRLISSLRLHPSRRSIKLRTGAAQIRGGAFILPVRNLGNTIEPVGGSFRLSGAGSRTGSIGAVRVIPGQLVGLNLGGTRGMKRGRYTVTASLVQAGKRINVRTSVTL
jgi:hypothetical protein